VAQGLYWGLVVALRWLGCLNVWGQQLADYSRDVVVQSVVVATVVATFFPHNLGVG